MTGRHVDLRNIGLMLVACALAVVLPFELFLFAYAVLGPLHDLTEISWLHHRGYLTVRRWDAALLVVPLAVLLLGRHGFVALDLDLWAPALNSLGLGFALAIAFFRDWRLRAAIAAVSFGVGAGLSGSTAAQDLLRVFLPTLIHVWLFTGAFILLGALRNRSAPGVASLAVFAGCSALCLVVRPDAAGEADAARMDRVASA